jgi:hypothetical protein
VVQFLLESTKAGDAASAIRADTDVTPQYRAATPTQPFVEIGLKVPVKIVALHSPFSLQRLEQTIRTAPPLLSPGANAVSIPTINCRSNVA